MKVLAFSLLLLSAAVAKGVVDTNANFDFSKFLSQMVKKMNNPGAERSNGDRTNQTKLSQSATAIVSISYEMKSLFDEIDNDGDGFISASEFLTFMEPLEVIAPEEVKYFVDWMINQLDSNGDGEIDYEEFVNMFDMGVSEMFGR